MASTSSFAPLPQSPEEFAHGMDSLPRISISSAIFEFLKSLNLQTVGKGLEVCCLFWVTSWCNMTWLWPSHEK